MPELLLELRSEEIPARMQARASADLAKLLEAMLAETGLAAAGGVEPFSGPRRLVLVARGVPARQADRMTQRKGPRVDAPEAARAGFINGLAGTAYRLEERPDKKATVLWAVIDEPGRAAALVLAERLPGILGALAWPKSMRWGDGEARWVRPLAGILCLFDGAVVPFAFAGLESGDVTAGHRFMAPAPFAVRDAADHAVRLLAAKVVLDAGERRRLIEAGALALAAAAGLTLRPNPGLLDELAGLVEWPVPLLGRIDGSFMGIPPEVLQTSMREHQRYLALEDAAGALAPAFIAVANVEADDGGEAIIAGNERVLRARLWDARFFWDQDRQTPLERLLPKLGTMLFHAELGTQRQRAERLADLAAQLVAWVAPGDDPGPARRAGLLAKADLVTGLVGEFPELQGVLGGHLARLQGEPPAVAAALAEQYSPKGADPAPTAPVSVALALADRLDALAGFFARGIRPTGSKDPFALRRAALGVLRLVLENGLRLPLRQAFDLATAGHAVRQPELASELLAFMAERLRVHLRDEGLRHDVVAAVFAAGQDDDLVRLVAKARALQAFLDGPDGSSLQAGYRRAANIVAIEAKKDGAPQTGVPDPALACDGAEAALMAELDRAEPAIADALGREAFQPAMTVLAQLRPPIDAFFAAVMVNAAEPELRLNRLRLLGRVRGALDSIADFSLLEEARP